MSILTLIPQVAEPSALQFNGLSQGSAKNVQQEHFDSDFEENVKRTSYFHFVRGTFSPRTAPVTYACLSINLAKTQHASAGGFL